MDADKNRINEDTDEKFSCNNLSQDWTENNNVTPENSYRAELEAYEDDEITSAEDEINLFTHTEYLLNTRME